jgi:hypothetical protein
MSPDASRRIAEVRDLLDRQGAVKSELAEKGLPTGGIDNLIEVLRACLDVIERSQQSDAVGRTAAS